MNLNIPARTFFAIWLGIAAIFIVSHFGFYFLKPHYEGGDYAANALQIRQAKDFRELSGNYSRFRFHHPGPAFFYAYALGELVLFDTLKVVPAPYNAHAITGIFIQAFFFTWALVIVARRVRRTLLLPLMLVFAGVHFGILNYNIPSSAFESIWPPYVLLFPFLCFIVACASFASGESKDLIPCVVAGGLLVHGHVAQPLFVLPLFMIACAAFWYFRQTTKDKSPRPAAALWTWVYAACIVGIFSLPLILDACKGEQSNLHLILQHLTQHASDHKSFAQSVTYLATFFYYLSNPEQYCDQLILSKLSFLVERMPFLWMWILIAIVIAVAPKPTLTSERRFYFWLLFIFAGAILLTIVWAMRQNAEMFAFNAYFSFGLLFVPFILLAISLVSWGEVRSAGNVRLLLCAVAIALGIGTAKSWTQNPNLHGAPSGTKEMVEKIRQNAVEDQQKAGTKFLSFEHDVWPWAVGVALVLDRAGYGYAIPANWAFIFGAHHTADLPVSLRRGDVALWRIKSPAAAGDKWISSSLPSINPAQAEIIFSGTEANASAFVIGGWDVSTGSFSWSTEKTALLYFSAFPSSSDVEIIFHLFPYTYSARKSQRLTISFNEEFVQSFQISEKSALSIRVPMEVWNRRSSATLAFEFPDAISPLAAGESADSRMLDCGFVRIEFRSSPSASAAPATAKSTLQALRSLSPEEEQPGRKDSSRWR